MSQTPNHLIPETDPVTEALSGLVGRNLYLMGHGSHPEAAAATMTEGLHSKHTELFSTVLGMESLSDDNDAVAHNMALLRQWPHLNSKYIVIVGVERLTEDEIPHRRYLQSIVQPREHGEEEDEQYGSPYVVPSRFVAGYFDMVSEKFVQNPDFNPRYDPNLLATTVNDEIRNERDTVDPLGHIAVGDETHRPISILPSDHDGSDVW